MQHPYHLIDKETVGIIRKYAAQAEREEKLTDQQLDIIYKNKWFNLFVPKDYGGLELSLPEALKLEEAVAWVDGSFGWTVTLCSGAGWFIGFLSQQSRDEIFINNKTCLAGSGRDSGTAKINDNRYEVTGQWDYATGASHATIFTANCVIEKDGVALENEDGKPMVKSLWFKREEVNIENNWKSTGMNATSSNSFEVNNLGIPLHRTFDINTAKATLKNPIYQFPFNTFAESTLAVNSSGMALHFLDLFEETTINNDKIARQVFYPGNPKTTIVLSDLLKNNKEVLDIKRAYFYNLITEAWRSLNTNSTVALELLQQVGNTSRDLAFTSLQIIDELYPYGGLTAADPEGELNRAWRDLHTASQHPLLRFPL